MKSDESKSPPHKASDLLVRVSHISSFSYEIKLKGTTPDIMARRGEQIVIRGSIRNTSGQDWPTMLSSEVYLEVGAELHIRGRKVNSARQKVDCEVLEKGQTVEFGLSMLANALGIGYCVVDLLYRHAFWLGARGATPLQLPIYIAPPLTAEFCDLIESGGFPKVASISNSLVLAAQRAPLHNLRCELVQKYLPSAPAVLDLGGASNR